MTFASLRSLLFLGWASASAEPPLRVKRAATAGTILTGPGTGDASASGL